MLPGRAPGLEPVHGARRGSEITATVRVEPSIVEDLSAATATSWRSRRAVGPDAVRLRHTAAGRAGTARSCRTHMLRRRPGHPRPAAQPVTSAAGSPDRADDLVPGHQREPGREPAGAAGAGRCRTARDHRPQQHLPRARPRVGQLDDVPPVGLLEHDGAHPGNLTRPPPSAPCGEGVPASAWGSLHHLVASATKEGSPKSPPCGEGAPRWHRIRHLRHQVTFTRSVVHLVTQVRLFGGPGSAGEGAVARAVRTGASTREKAAVTCTPSARTTWPSWTASQRPAGHRTSVTLTVAACPGRARPRRRAGRRTARRTGR